MRHVNPARGRPLHALAVAAAACAALAASPLRAQEPISLEGLVVTAHRWAEPEWTVAANTTVIEGEELERAGIEFVSDALRHVAGLAVARNGSFGAITSVFLRGGESDYVHVLVDGVRVNEPGGSYDFASLTTDNVERIEIVRGPASALYGSDAVSGVIQIFTRRGAGPPRGSVSFQTGSFGTTRWQGDLSGGGGGLSYAFSLGGSATDGILAFNNEHRQTTATGRVQANLDADTDATFAIRYNDSRFHYPTDGSGNVVDRNAYSFGDALTVNIDAGRRWTDALETRLFLSVWESDRGTDDGPDNPADSLGFFGFKSLTDTRRVTAGGRAVWRPAEGMAVTAGVEEERQSVRGFNRSFSQFGESAGNSEDDWWNRAAHAQFSWARDALALNAGLRAEDDERFGAAATWRTGAAWRADASGTRLRVSAGTGIKEPTFFETFATGFVTGNPDLTPERSTSFEGGIDQDVGGSLKLSLTGFSQNYRDLIQYTGSPPAEGDPNFFNVAKARSRGLEAEASVEARQLRLTGSWTYLDTEVLDSGFDEGPGATFVEGSALLRRPKHAMAASAFYPVSSAVGLDVRLRRVGEREDRDFSSFPAEPVMLPAYTVLDVSASFDIAGRGGGPGFTLTVRGENLLDSAYEEVWGFAAPGRGLYVGGRVILGGGP
ncbi:TonB-dependent receptor plug domain-containing protein [Candidatus Palauibacter irciniicola]|uniref:TonB-dependent receptor plug domain-containing protein n=1 Tax=Candidatus Palauibacter irciniicola TaxID=3056733 RepID=UPI003B01788C